MAELTIHVHHHFDGDLALDRKLDALLSHIRAVHAQGDQIIMLSEESKALLGRIDTATNNIAADLRGLKDKIDAGASDTEIKAELEKRAVLLESIAASTEDPVPTPEP
jgi:hypothetical protein